MTEREIIINLLVARANDESHPDFCRLAAQSLGIAPGTISGHPLEKKWLEKCEFLGIDFDNVFYKKDEQALRKYYECLSPESLVEAFDGWACRRYR
jgi:hypothetical protein